MDAFSYLSVVLSIVLGLGLTQLLTVLGRLIRHRERVRADWLPLLWAATLLLMYVQAWWAMFGLRNVRAWTFGQFVIVLGETASLYMMAAVALPEQIDDAGVDLRAFYDRQHRWFFAFFLGTLAISIAKDALVGGHLPERANLEFHAVFAIICVVAMATRRRRVQEVLGVGATATVGLYIWLLFTRLR